MSQGHSEKFGPVDPEALQIQLRALASRRADAGIVDDLELQHLVSVIFHGAMLLHDLYSSDRIGTVYSSDPRAAARSLIVPLLADGENANVDLLARVGRLPEEVRLLGDKCLFDVGITRIRKYKGLDLQDLGTRAYRMASEILGVLGEDVTLREFFDRNRLAPLPIAEEVTFLKQCSERFGIHADLLLHLNFAEAPQSDTTPGVIVPPLPDDKVIGIPRLSTMPDDVDLPEPAGAFTDLDTSGLSREDLLSSYERIVLFSALDLEALRTSLNTVVVDQGEAVDALCDEFSLYAAGTHSLTKPPSYFFVGPTGVGKNYLVETLVRFLGKTAGVEIPLLTIDGPNFTDPSDINELRGSTRGFIRSDEEGVLAEFHQRSSQAPLSVILVDEVEKAHPHLRKFFLSLMDRGTVTDNRGKTLFFANSLIVFTSNLGYSEAVSRGTPIGYRGDEAREEFENSEVGRSLRQSLSAEFVNRLRIIRFQHLSRRSIETIFDLEFDKVRRRFAEIHGVELEATQAARDEMLSQGYSFDYGARHLGAVINRLANVEVSKRLKRDDRTGPRGEKDVLEYLRQVRRKERAFDPREVRARVLGAARVKVPYRSLTIDFEDGEFTYRS